MRKQVIVVAAFVACGLMASCGGANPPSPGPIARQPLQPVSADDVSWLFPAPANRQDVQNLIAIDDLSSADPKNAASRLPIWSDAAFAQFVANVDGPAGAVDGSQDRISLPPQVRSKAAWHVAGVRIDAGAPGLSQEIRGQFGQRPQIRLILQPVVANADGSVTVFDMTAHLVFDFVTGTDAPAKPGCFPRAKPDMTAFGQIVVDAAAIRTGLSHGQLGGHVVQTAGRPLGVHPGLTDPATAPLVRAAMISLLDRHLSNARLGAMSAEGLPANATAPWIFLAMLGVAPGTSPDLPQGGFVPVHSPTLNGQQFAQMLQPVGVSPRVVPEPHANNLAPIDCVSAVLQVPGPPIDQRHGVSTAALFADTPPATAAARSIVDVVADPTRSHFFNTDCVSCHTETRRSMELLGVNQIAGLDSNVLPTGPYDIRNFGWSPVVDGPVRATATRRTAAETQAVVNFINSAIGGT